MQDAPGAKDLVVDSATVAFEGVSFEYSAGTAVLHDVNFKADGGQTVALVGATGSGRVPCILCDCHSDAAWSNGRANQSLHHKVKLQPSLSWPRSC